MLVAGEFVNTPRFAQAINSPAGCEMLPGSEAACNVKDPPWRVFSF